MELLYGYPLTRCSQTCIAAAVHFTAVHLSSAVFLFELNFFQKYFHVFLMILIFSYKGPGFHIGVLQK